jgi:hypothetical protein
VIAYPLRVVSIDPDRCRRKRRLDPAPATTEGQGSGKRSAGTYFRTLQNRTDPE